MVKMGQEISWRKKPNISTLCAREVYLTVLVPTCTRVKDYGRVAVSQISGCGRPQIIHTSMEMAAFNGMSTRVCIFKGIVYVDWKHRIGSDIGRCSKKNIGHRIGRQNWHRLILSGNRSLLIGRHSIPQKPEVITNLSANMQDWEEQLFSAVSKTKPMVSRWVHLIS